VQSVDPGPSPAGESSLLARQDVLRFEHFTIKAAERQLLLDGQPVTVGSRAFDLLMALIKHRDRVVTKNELLDLVWPGLVVEEGNLAVQVSSLRKLLGAGSIATIPGRGYRFTVPPADTSLEVEPMAAPPQPGLRTNMPPKLQPLIGRDDDLAALGALLADHRLITITGAGGMGKTRLAERVVHERRDDFEHGVTWVELAALADPALLPGTLAGAMGLQTGGGDPLQGLVASLAPLQMLVAIDNAEHLVGEVARLVQALLGGAPRLRFVVTSQAPLRLAAERVYRLGGLAVPDADDDLADALAYGAVDLFVQRAQAADRHFVADAQALPAIRRICAQLDGVALALELAAARVPMLGVAGLARFLDERLQLLTQGRRDAPQRQSTLRAALEWSLALLSSTEAIVFRRLEAARRVAADPDGAGLNEWQVVDGLGVLVDRSLVAADLGELPRYRLLESARALALERFAASGEGDVLRERHAAATQRRFEQVTIESRDGVRGVDEAVALLDPDLDNARAALTWYLARGDALGAVTLAPAMSFALTISRHAERSRLWELTTPLMRDELPPLVRATWAAACSGHWYWRKPALAIQWGREAVRLYRELDDDGGVYRALSILGMALARADLREECETTCAELRRFDEGAFSARLQFMANAAYLGLADRRADVAAMQQTLRHQLTLAERAGDTGNVLNALSSLADTELAAGRVDDAVRHGIALEERLRATRHQSALAYARVGLTGALLAQGALEAAREMAQQAWPLAMRFDIRYQLADNLALLAALEQRADAAAKLRGYADAGYAAYGLVRQTTEARAAERADALARTVLGQQEFDRLLAEGAELGDGEVLRTALSHADGE
jgi:predicted ATPase/DNA-binding winged helix-turn-helix (wHTH) protein